MTNKTQPNKNVKTDPKDQGMTKYAVVHNPKEKEAQAKAKRDIEKSQQK